MADRTHTVTDSIFGPLTLVATDGELSGLYMVEQRHRPAETSFGSRVDSGFGADARSGEQIFGADARSGEQIFGQVIEQLDAYFAGELTDFDLPLALAGTPFQRQVWAALQEIPYGETVSYGELAERIGRPTASRAVGLANGKNPVGIIVPCHRVVGSTGDLTGYGGGIERKRHLLDFERATRESLVAQ